MEDKVLKARGRGLEESFFAKHNEKLLKQLQAQAEAKARRQELRAATGITDDAVLDRLLELDLCHETVVALGLVPLLEVAWADGQVQAKEREAIIRAAETEGVAPGSPSLDLMEGWLERPLRKEMLDAWKDYVGAVADSLDDGSRAALKSALLGRARAVAGRDQYIFTVD